MAEVLIVIMQGPHDSYQKGAHSWSNHIGDVEVEDAQDQKKEPYKYYFCR